MQDVGATQEVAVHELSVQRFEDFVALRYRGLVRSAYLLVGDAGHAEDLVQSALMSTLGAWDKLNSTDAATSYTRTTMIRLAGRWGRRRWHGELPRAEPPESLVLADGTHDQSIDLRRALGRLPWPQRAVLVLRYFDDLSEAQTAAVLGCSPGTVKSRANRALAALRASGLTDGVDSP